MNQPTTNSAAFVAPISTFCRRWGGVSTRCAVTPHRSAKRRVAAPSMMAKYQERDNPEKPAEETPIDNLVPPVQLPTLSTLSGDVDAEAEGIDLSQLNKPVGVGSSLEELEMKQMGAALTSDEEFKILQFLKEVVEEFKTIEWPSAGRVFKILVIVIISIIVAAVALYIVDGFFYSMSQYLFETP